MARPRLTQQKPDAMPMIETIAMSLRAAAARTLSSKRLRIASAVRQLLASVQAVMRPRSALHCAALALPALVAGCGVAAPTYFVPPTPTAAASPATGVPDWMPNSVARAFPDANSAHHLDGAPTRSEMANFGERIEQNGLRDGCNVDLVLQSDEFLDNLPRLQQAGLMNPNITPQIAAAQLLSVSLAFTLQAAAIAAHEFVQQPSAPRGCHFRQAIQVLVSGAEQSLPMFEFDWDRGIDDKGAWTRVLSDVFTYEDAKQFVAVAPGFKLAPNVAATIRKENRA
jgi:hypothetical protein